MGVPQFANTTAILVQQIQATASQISADVLSLKNTDMAQLAAAVVNKRAATKYTKYAASVSVSMGSKVTLLNITGKGYVALAVVAFGSNTDQQQFIMTRDGVAETWGYSSLINFSGYAPLSVGATKDNAYGYMDKSDPTFYTTGGRVHPLIEGELLFFDSSLKLEVIYNSGVSSSTVGYQYHVGVFPA